MLKVLLPDAVYFDANVLIALPHHLRTTPMSELQHLAQRLQAPLLVPQVAAEEWMARQARRALECVQEIRDHAQDLADFLNQGPLAVEHIAEDELRRDLRKAQLERLSSTGIAIVPTPPLLLPGLIGRSLAHEPPFSENDRGFRDAVILDTMLDHATSALKASCVLFLTADAIFTEPTLLDRFAAQGTTLRVVRAQQAKDVVPAAVGLLKELMEAAGKEFMEANTRAALEYVRQHQKEVFDFVKKNARLTMSLLQGLTLRHAYDQRTKDLQGYTVRSVNGVRPKEIASALVGLGHEARPSRESIVIFVDIEIDVTAERYDFAAGPAVPLESAGQLPELHTRWRRPREVEKKTVVRQLLVQASVAGEGALSGHFTDLRLEKVY